MGLFEEALLFATEKHGGKFRKGNRLPYILHPIEAAAIVGSMTEDQEILAAAVLHDTIEDADVTEAELRERFGDRVADLVLTETEDKRSDRPAEDTWQVRKEETLKVLRTTEDPAVRMLWLGDKLANMRAFYRQYLKEGNDLWQHFHQKDPAVQAWYYRSVEAYLMPLHDYPAFKEYSELVAFVFRKVH